VFQAFLGGEWPHQRNSGHNRVRLCSRTMGAAVAAVIARKPG
jgi:hypothetical protein